MTVAFLPGPLVSLQFGEAPSGQTRLFSIGQDGRVAEYDLQTSGVTTGLQVRVRLAGWRGVVLVEGGG